MLKYTDKTYWELSSCNEYKQKVFIKGLSEYGVK